MKLQMNIRQTLSIALGLFAATFAVSSSAIEDIVVDYSFQGSAPTNLSNMKATLHFAEFIDSRSGADANLLTDKDLGLGSADGYQLDQAAAEVVRGALLGAFTSADAKLVDSDGEMYIAGDLLGIDAQIVDRAGVESIQITFRTNIQLRSGSRMVWQTTIFGRGTRPAEEGIQATIHAAMKRTIDDLLLDDYFLAEIR